MSQPPGPEKLVSPWEDIRSKVEAEVRKEVGAQFAQIRDEINQGRVDRAEQHANYMRNWLAILTVTISVVLVGFGVLGYTRTSDIDAYRKQIAADATDVKALAGGVRENSKAVADSVNSIRTSQQQVAALDTKINDADTRITNTDKNIAAIEKRSNQAEQRIVAAVNNTSALAQQTHNDFQSSLASGFLGDVPTISTATLVQGPALSFIEGTRFGNSDGHIFVDIQQITLASSSQLPTRIEIQPPYKTWTDTKITFELSPSEYQKIKDARASQSSESSASGSLSITSTNLLSGLSSSTYLSC